MRTLPREPWRGGQICGYQIAYGLPWSIFCGEFKKLGSPLCEEHDQEMREEHYGVLPEFAPGNAAGLSLTQSGGGWSVPRGHWVVGHTLGWMAASPDKNELERRYGFTLSWEPYDGDVPVPATEEEVKAWKASSTTSRKPSGPGTM